MKKTLETGEEKIQKILDSLRKKTLEPAKQEAQKIISDAHQRAEEIIREAQNQADQYVKESQKSIEKERNVFYSALTQAGKQSVEMLRQNIEQKLLNPELQDLIIKHSAKPEAVAQLIQAVVEALEKEGLNANIAAYIPHHVSVSEVNQLLGHSILDKLKGKSVVNGDFAGGAKIKIEDNKLVFDISDTELEELLSQYIRKDFRKLFFA